MHVRAGFSFSNLGEIKFGHGGSLRLKILKYLTKLKKKEKKV
jgi:hypothetical protein